VKAVIVRHPQGNTAAADGTYIRFDENAAVVIDDAATSRWEPAYSDLLPREAAREEVS